MLFDSWLSRLGFLRELASEADDARSLAMRVASGGARARRRLRRSRSSWRLAVVPDPRCAPVLIGGVLVG
jgi:hypothetical protein